MNPLPAARRDRIGSRLLEWYLANRRDLPWRHVADPYAVWVSEMMLQQTQVATVIPYFERWMARFPTLRALADADEQEVLLLWQGLGYYSRARNLHRAAQTVLRDFDGIVPHDPEILRRLPGVGAYTAGAISSLAYGRPAPIVDGNVVRVLTRLFALAGDPRRAPLQGTLWRLSGELIPDGRARDFNSALMELGATVCRPRTPDCARCPLADECDARATNTPERFPELAARPAVTPVRMVALVLSDGERVLIRRRPADAARWAGMWEFPNGEVEQSESECDAALRLAAGVGTQPHALEPVALIRHSVTRFRIHLHAWRGTSAVLPAGDGLHQVSLSACRDHAMPAAHVRIVDELLRREWTHALGFEA